MKIRIAGFLMCMCILLMSCQSGARGVSRTDENLWSLKRNEEIDVNILTEIKSLNSMLVNSIRNKNDDEFIELCSKEFLDTLPQTERNEFLSTISEIIKDFEYEQIDSYLCNFNNLGNNTMIITTYDQESFNLCTDPQKLDFFKLNLHI